MSSPAVFVAQALLVATKLFFPLFLGMGLVFCLGLFRLPKVRIWFPIVGAIVGAPMGYALYSTANPDRMLPYSSPAGGGVAGLIAGLLIATTAAILKRGFQRKSPIATEPTAIDLVKRTQPRLGIVHLMLWMAACAILLSLRRWLVRDGNAGNNSLLLISFFVTNVMISGVSIASLALWGSRRLRGGVPFPTEPGHYLLLLQGGAILILHPVLSSVIIRCALSLGLFLRAPLLFYLTKSILAGCLAMLVLWCLSAAIRSLRWKAVFLAYFLGLSFAALALLASLSLLFDEPYKLDPTLLWLPLQIAVGLSLTAAIILDVRSDVRRDWLHYVGAATWFASTAHSWLFRVALWMVNIQMVL
jgi:hypothetical protein